MRKQAERTRRRETRSKPDRALEEIAEAKRAEEASQRTVLELDAIFRALPDLYFRMDSDGTILDYKAGRAVDLYVPPESFIGQRMQSVLPPEAGNQFANAIEELARGKQQVSIEYTLPFPDGAKSFEARLLPLQSDQFIAVVQDITERKRVEERIRKLNQDLERQARELAALNKAGQMMNAMLDLDAVLGTVMAEVRELLDAEGASVLLQEEGELVFVASAGHGSEALVGTRLPVASGIAGRVMRKGKAVLVDDARNDPYFYDRIDAMTGLTTRSLVAVPLIVRGVPRGVIEAINKARSTFDEHDLNLLEGIAGPAAIAIENARLFAAVDKELIERVQAERELQRRNQELAALNAIAMTISQSMGLDAALNATLDKILEVMQLSGSWVQLLGEDGDALELVAQRGIPEPAVKEIQKIKLGEDIPSKLAETGQPFLADDVLHFVRAKLEGKHEASMFALMGGPITSKDKMLGVLGGVSYGPHVPGPDQEQLLTTIGHEIGIVVENARLARQAAEVEILRGMDRLRSELIANVSHELRTPLGLIKISSTSLLMDDVEFDRETQRKFLYSIDEETTKLEQIVEHLLDLGRMESGRLQLDKQPTDLSQLIKNVIAKMRTRSAQHRLMEDLPSEPLVASIDAKRIEQVLRNLLDNAIKYSPAGGTITMSGRRDKWKILVLVSDHGIGIPVEEQGKIFERFYRVENEVTRCMRGAGLGLPVCQGIVEAHGGRIWVESRTGAGSTFCFTLPTEP
jgi:signal transduction histidine kinase